MLIFSWSSRSPFIAALLLLLLLICVSLNSCSSCSLTTFADFLFLSLSICGALAGIVHSWFITFKIDCCEFRIHLSHNNRHCQLNKIKKMKWDVLAHDSIENNIVTYAQCDEGNVLIIHPLCSFFSLRQHFPAHLNLCLFSPSAPKMKKKNNSRK